MIFKPTLTASTPEAQANARRHPHRRTDQATHSQKASLNLPDPPFRSQRRNQTPSASGSYHGPPGEDLHWPALRS
eukprot:3768475-Pleurochrysis_carterae.AAC.1